MHPSESFAQPLPTPEQNFTAHMSVMAQIPIKFCGFLAEAYAATIQEAARACQNRSPYATVAVAKLFLFPGVTLTSPSHTLQGTEERCCHSIDNSMRERIELWNGQVLYSTPGIRYFGHCKLNPNPGKDRVIVSNACTVWHCNAGVAKQACGSGPLLTLIETREILDIPQCSHSGMSISLA